MGSSTGRIPQFVCHYHLAADVGKDILSPHVDRLRRLFRRTKVRPKLREIVRSLKDASVCREDGIHVLGMVLTIRSKAELRQCCTSEVANGVVHGLASWILAYSQEGEGYGFPFDMPYLALYERVLKVHRVLSAVSEISLAAKRGPLGPLRRLKAVLDPVTSGHYAADFQELVEATRRDRRIFERFRRALRICPKGGKQRRNDRGAPKTLSPKRHKAILETLRASLEKKVRSGHPSKRAARIVTQHLNKYWPLLFGHALRRGGREIIVPRTNNMEEGLFRLVKRQCRRLHGRGHLRRDLDAMLPGTPLVLNLRNVDYCRVVYGAPVPTIDSMAEVFSTIDPKAAAHLLRTWRCENLSTSLPEALGRANDLPRRVAPFVSMLAAELLK